MKRGNRSLEAELGLDTLPKQPNDYLRDDILAWHSFSIFWNEVQNQESSSAKSHRFRYMLIKHDYLISAKVSSGLHT